jgi:SAM-dependent methyltransferase
MVVYPEVLGRLQSGDRFLDLGCCFGQEIRQLVLDGAPSDNTYGSDMFAEYFSVRYDLFNDKERLKTTFVAGDIFDDSSPLRELAGTVDIIYTGAFFHLFSLEDQENIVHRSIQLHTPQPGSLPNLDL